MAETTLEEVSTPTQWPRSVASSAPHEEQTPSMNVIETESKTPTTKDDDMVYVGHEHKPLTSEVLGWFFYGFCSYFIHTVLIPVVFPLIISQISVVDLRESGVERNARGLVCGHKELLVYQALTNSSITINNLHLTPLEWTSISWALGLIISLPLLGLLSAHLDHGPNQHLIAAAATAVGALFCLPAGFFRTTWIFPPYVAIVVAASTVCSAAYTRHLGLMVRGSVGSAIRQSRFPDRRAVAGWLSLYATAAGCLGAALIAAFAYQMLSHTEKWLSLWIVSIFSGLIWAAGIIHVFIGPRGGIATPSPTRVPKSHIVSIFRYPHATGSLAGVFLSSSTTMCIFTGSLLYLTGELCLEPRHLLFLWLTYFAFPLFSLPLVQPLQHLIRADAVKMQLLGFLLSILTSGVGFYYRRDSWKIGHLLVLTAVQSTGTGILHAYARVLLLDCSPPGKEGAFAAWFSWMRSVGACVGFVMGSYMPGHVSVPLGVAFWGGVVGVVVLIFGNVSSFWGAVAAGNVQEYSEKESPREKSHEEKMEV